MNRCRRVRRDAPFNAVRLIPDSTNSLYPFGRPSVTTVRGRGVGRPAHNAINAFNAVKTLLLFAFDDQRPHFAFFLFEGQPRLLGDVL